MSEGSREPLPLHAMKKLLAAASPAPAPAPPSAGQDRYRILRELGRGGMGVVYEAEDTALGRRVALKVLAVASGDGATAASARERFAREAMAAARLDHPNIAAVYDAVGDRIAMQLIDGEPLAKLPPDSDPRRAVLLLRDAARAVHYAHQQGIVHRDLKPHNLMLASGGDRVVVTDFGLAKETSLDAEPSLSVSGHLLGTPAYMAPEQAQGRVHAVDARTDVYGLGATLYHVLTGRPPFVERDVVRLLRQVADDDPPQVCTVRHDLAKDLGWVVHKCLAKEPERRYPSADALADDLTRWLAGEPVRAEPPSLGYRAVKFVRRRKALVVVVAVAVIGVSAAALWTGIERSRRQASKEALRLSLEVAAILDEARTFLALGEVDNAYARLDAGIAACRAFAGRSQVGEAEFMVARLLRARGHGEAALLACDAALRLEPDLSAARAERGLVRAHELSLRLQDTPAHALAAMDAEQARMHADALEDLDAALRRPRGLTAADLACVRAEAARLRGDLAAAEAGYVETLRLDPVRYEARIGRSRVALARGDHQAARTLAMAALDIWSGLAPSYVERRGAPDAALGAGAAATPPSTVELTDIEGVLFDFAGALFDQAAAFGHRAVVHARTAAEHVAEDPARALTALDAALADLDAALRHEGDSAALWNDRAVLGWSRAPVLERLGRATDASSARSRARADFDQALTRVSADIRHIVEANRARLMAR